jgi:hypothetical protein
MSSRSDVCIYQYFELLQKLLDAREAAGGELSQEKESEFVVKLDEIWRLLSAQEQDFVEEELKSGKWLPLQANPLRH